MARPRGIGGAIPVRKEPAAVPPPHHDDMLEQHTSMVNRQNVPFESPMASFHRAAANMRERHDQARKQQQLSGNKVNKSDLMAWQAEAADRQAMYHYKHHFTDMRGAQTVKRENIVVKKP